MTTEAAAAPARRIKVTVTEESTATYLVTPEWLEAHGFPNTLAELTDHLTNGSEYAPKEEDPVDALALKLEEHDETTLSEYSVTERDLYLDLAE